MLLAPKPWTSTAATRRIYTFAEGDGSMRDIFGGKGAGLAEMTQAGLPVPPGFTITAQTCLEFYKLGRRFPDGLDADIMAHVGALERADRQDIRRNGESAARFRAQRRARLDARHDGHDPQSRARPTRA